MSISQQNYDKVNRFDLRKGEYNQENVSMSKWKEVGYHGNIPTHEGILKRDNY